MPVCPICGHELQKPPKDVRDWFRCEKCGTPLRMHSSLSKTLYWFSILGGLLLSLPLALFSIRYFQGRELSMFFLAGLLGGTILAVYAALARLFWNTKFTCPKPFDPYSSLNLSDARTKSRGHVSERLPHNPFRALGIKLQPSRYRQPCPACLRIFGPSDVREHEGGYFRCPACGEWLEHDFTDTLRVFVLSALLALILSWRLGYRGALFSVVLIAAFLLISVIGFFVCAILFPSGYKRAGD